MEDAKGNSWHRRNRCNLQTASHARTKGARFYFSYIKDANHRIQMLHYETIEPNTLELLKKLQALPLLSKTRLVGGTSLALQLGHRKSVDLDLFGQVECDAMELAEALRSCGSVTQLKASSNINIFVVNGVKVDIVNYSFLWLEETLEEDGIVLARLQDIAAMKVNAVIGRGTRKDFIDLAHIMKTYTLPQVLHFYFAKYPEASMFLAAKSLAYFADADMDPMPYMFTEESWADIKAYISKQYEEYGDKLE